MMRSIICLLAIATLSFASVSCKKHVAKSTRQAMAEKSVFMAPFKNIQISGNEYVIKADRDTTVTCSSGTRIIVPKNAFTDSTGARISGEVNLLYREFKNPLEIYLAGIPMLYDSLGVEQVLVSAGMFEMNAYSEGKTLFPDPENRIRVEMTSFDPSSRFNVYKLDTITGKWAYLGKDKVTRTRYADAVEEIPSIPEPPQKAGPFSFTIHDGTGLRPELNIYKNVRFDPDDKKRHGFDATNITVDDLKNGKYRVKFLLYGREGIVKVDSCDCFLSFREGEDYDNVQKPDNLTTLRRTKLTTSKLVL